MVGKNAIYNSTTVKHTKTRLLRTNVLNNFEAYKGYNDFRRMAYGMATVVRLSAKVYTLPTQGIYNMGSHVHQNAVKIIGHYKGTEASLVNAKVEKIKNTRRTVNNTLSGKPLKEFNAKYGSTARGVITEAEKAAARGVKVVGKGAKAAGNTWAAHTNTGKQAKKVYQGFVKQNKKIGKKAQKVLKPFKKAWSSTSLAFKKIASKFNIAKLKYCEKIIFL